MSSRPPALAQSAARQRGGAAAFAPSHADGACGQGMDAAAPRSMADLADADADALPAAARVAAVAQLSEGTTGSRSGAGHRHGGGTARGRTCLARGFGRGRAGSGGDRAGLGRRRSSRAKIEAVHGRRSPSCSCRSSRRLPGKSLCARGGRDTGIIVAAASATAIQLWFRAQAKRSQFRRRQTSSRVATFAEAFSSIAWAGAAALAAVDPLFAVGPAAFALGVLFIARAMRPAGG